MNIFANTVVTLTFQLYDGEGTLLEETPEPIAYLHGGHSGMLPKLEEALNHKAAGDDVSVTIEPADGFGDYDPDLVKVEGVDRVFTVTDIADGKVVLDGNHPWAGRLLRFDCRILDVRPATREELEHGHVHGPGGHHHH